MIWIAGCAAPKPEATSVEPTETPGRRPPPSAPFSSDQALLADRVEEALFRYDKGRWERFVDAMDPGELSADLRIAQEEIDTGLWRLEWLFNLGDELFEHDFSGGEGFGPGRKRVHLGVSGGPDSLSCAECHHRGGFDGAGDLSQNAFFDGDGYAPESGFERNAPHTLGLGAVQRLAEEMTASLRATRGEAIYYAQASRLPQTLKLQAKGVSFGAITAHPDGSVDLSKAHGVLPDLVVRPFGWKSGQSSIRDFVRDGFQRHHGLQTNEETSVGSGPNWDKDGDQSSNEIAPGMLSTVTIYLALLEVPVMITPKDPALLERHGSGWETFHAIGCGDCHRQSLGLEDPLLKITEKLSVNVLTEGEEPRPRRDVFVHDENNVGTPVFLFSDLRLHAMGPELAEGRATANGVPPDVFLTRSLWGVADTAPYLHDGRARTLDEAILAHGGEAETSRKAFERLSPAKKADIRIFLLSLTRYPRIEYR